MKINNKFWHTEKGFINPEGNITTRGFRWASVRWILGKIFASPYKLGIDLPKEHLLTKEESLSLLEQHKGNDSITWLGHATFLFKINGLNIITDPFFFGSPGTSLLRGLKRIPSPLKGEDLEKIDVMLISHEHHDHIHHPSLKSLKNKVNISLITPLGVSKKLKKYNFSKTKELDWFDNIEIGHNIKITAIPAVHYSNFSNTTLWAGFVISFKDNSGLEKKIYFGGDSGYGPFIKKYIAPYGTFDVACIGVGAFYLKFPSRAPIVHTNPEQAIDIAKEIDVKKIIGMHWGTTRLSDENPKELFSRMQKHAKDIEYKGNIKNRRNNKTINFFKFTKRVIDFYLEKHKFIFVSGNGGSGKITLSKL